MMNMMKDAASRWQRLKVPRTLAVIARVALAALTATLGAHEAEAKFFPLNTVPVPEPPNLAQFVKNKAAAIQLGKALFWDVQVGSDGKTACASCHFSAGADSRAKNQLAPSAGAFALAPSNAFSTALGFGPDHELVAGDFPFTKHGGPGSPNSGPPGDPPPPDPNMISDTNDVASSQGVFKRNFVGVAPLGNPVDECTFAADGVFFHVGAGNVRRASPRNAPSVINAVFNLRQFWDGRGRENFNGINIKGVNNADGTGDPLAGAFKSTTPLAVPKRVPLTGLLALQFSSLASQAVAPPTSPVILSCNGRLWAQIGQKLLNRRVKPLEYQQVDPTDSVLGLLRNRLTGKGLLLSYSTMIKRSFQPAWWNSVRKVTVGGKLFTQMQANMPLFFGLAVQLYEATLVSDQSLLDHVLAGDPGFAFNADQAAGMALFEGKGCGECHSGAEFTNASVSQAMLHNRVNRGYANIGTRPTADDLGLGGIVAGVPVGVGEFKIPTLRNVELTGPYFHNGGKATLKQVVEFYNRGGDFRNAAIDPLIRSLGMSPTDQTNMVEFLKTLTDPRVRIQAAPFDHPSLDVPNGSLGVDLDGDGQADDNMVHISAVGGAGDPAHPLQPFLGLDPQTPE